MNSWTDKERNILRDYYYMVDSETIKAMLPGRTMTQIYSQVHYLRKRGWAFKGRFKK